jgi:hypothetical protein
MHREGGACSVDGLRHYVRSREVTGSSSDKVIYLLLNLPNVYGHTKPWGLLSLQQK